MGKSYFQTCSSHTTTFLHSFCFYTNCYRCQILPNFRYPRRSYRWRYCMFQMLHLNHIYQPTKWKSVISFVLVKNTVKLVCLLQMVLLVTIPLHTLRLVFPLHTKPVLLHSVPMPNKL